MTRPRATARRLAAATLAAATALAFAAPGGQAAGAQTQYFDLDAGRPTRVEDASATSRYALDLHMAPVRVERLDDGSYRFRAEPEVSFGALPFTEVELRMPFAGTRVGPGRRVRWGITSLGVGVLRAINLETLWLPALAVATEVQIPAGQLAAPRATYAVKLLGTRGGPRGRLHVNVAGGTYSVRQAGDSACLRDPNAAGCGVFIPDPFCSIVRGSSTPARLGRTPARAACAGGAQQQQQAAPAPRMYGPRWMVGVGADRAFPLASWLVGADVVAERFQGYQAKTDVVVEVGVRRQWTPQLVVDAGVGRRVAGAFPSTSVTVGATYSVAMRPTPNVPPAAAGPGRGSR